MIVAAKANAVPGGHDVVFHLATMALEEIGKLSMIFIDALHHSPIGDDEETAASVGKRVFVFRLQSFVIGSMLMGLGGALYAHFVGFIAPEDFLPILTFQIWAMLIVGGAGNNRGAVIGALVVWGFWSAAGGVLRDWIPQAEQARAAALQVVLIGVLIAGALLLRPRGLLGKLRNG